MPSIQMLAANNPVESFMSPEQRERTEKANTLLHNIKKHLPELEALLTRCEDHWGIEDGIYRFYHQSFKVYHLQQSTEEICAALRSLLPGEPLNPWFSEIITQGTKCEFVLSHNQDWLRHTRPIVEAAFHAHHFLKLAAKYGKELDVAPDCLPSGWATVLYLYDLR
jgi:hypothetical protein